MIVGSARRTRSGSSSGCSSHEKSLPSAVDRLAARIGEALGSEVELERPKDPSHGDFATNVAMRSAKAVGRAAARARARSSRTQIAGLDEVDAAEVAGPGFVNMRVRDAFFLGRSPRWARTTAAAGQTRPERVQVEMVSANPTGPIVVSAARNGAYGDCVARLLAFGGHEVAREYYYNDAGAQMDRFRASVDALRRGEPVAGGRLPRRLRRRARASRGRPGAADARVDRAHDGALPHPLRQLGAAERARAAPARAARRGSTPTRRTARSGRARRPTATSRTGC